MAIKGTAILVVLAALLTSCGSNQGGKEAVEEDLVAKQLMQGIWIDDETDMPMMRIEGDTIYYTDAQNAPVSFKIVHDSIYLCGYAPVAYKIDRQTEYSFWFHSLTDEIVKLHKSEDEEDSLAFASQEVEIIPTIREVVKKDSIVMYQNTRYRGYVYINPSKIKVFKPTYSENGIQVDNVYYDNIIHICVYEGKKMLYGKDISKKMFAEVLPAEVLDQSILADMDFVGVDENGYRYQAILAIPETSAYNVVTLVIGFDNALTIKKENNPRNP